MAFNQVAKYYQGYVSSVGHTGGIIAGLWGLLVKGSTHVSGVCTDPTGNIYVTDAKKHIVLKVTESGVISVLSGLSGTSGNNGANTVTAANARFNFPSGICCDRNGDIYVCDTNNHQIRKISNNKVSLVAGAAIPTAGTADGTGTSARFNRPHDIDISRSGLLYVADTNNHAIRKIDGGVVSTTAGLKGTSGNVPVWADMTTAQGVLGTVARFNNPHSVAVDPNGYIFVGDTDNHVIKRIDPAARVRIFSGSGAFGTNIGTAKTSTYQDLTWSDIDRSGSLFIVDFNEGGTTTRILRVNGEGVPAVVVDFSGSSSDPHVVSVVVNNSANLVVVESDFTSLLYSSSSSTSESSSSTSDSSSSSTSESSSSSTSESSSSSSTSESSSSSSS